MARKVKSGIDDFFDFFETLGILISYFFKFVLYVLGFFAQIVLAFIQVIEKGILKIAERNDNKKDKSDKAPKTSEIEYKCNHCNTIVKAEDKFCPKCEFKFVSQNELNNTNKSNVVTIGYEPVNYRKKLKLIDINKYEDLFNKEDIASVKDVLKKKNIYKLKQSNNSYTCNVLKEHDVTLEFDGKEIIKATCTCNKHKKYCKHIYLLLYKVITNSNKDKLAKELMDRVNYVNNKREEVLEYANKNKDKFDAIEVYNYMELTAELLFSVSYSEYDARIKESEEKMLDSLNEIDKTKVKIDYLSNRLLNHENTNKVTTKEVVVNDATEETNYGQYNNDIDDYIEDDSNSDDIVYNELEDWQKREVDEENYDSYNFEEEELEEDDYYYEDDME